jgi:hypothetical protein
MPPEDGFEEEVSLAPAQERRNGTQVVGWNRPKRRGDRETTRTVDSATGLVPHVWSLPLEIDCCHVSAAFMAVRCREAGRVSGNASNHGGIYCCSNTANAVWNLCRVR